MCAKAEIDIPMERIKAASKELENYIKELEKKLGWKKNDGIQPNKHIIKINMCYQMFKRLF